MLFTVDTTIKKAKIQLETATTTGTTTAMTTTAMTTMMAMTLKTKVHSQGFLLVPKSGQKVMVITVIFRAQKSTNSARDFSDDGNSDSNEDDNNGDNDGEDIEDEST